MYCVSMMVYWNLHYVLQKTLLHLRYYNRLLSMFPPKTKAAQEFVNCGKEGSSAQAELHQQCPGNSLRTREQLGKICCLGKEVASGCLHPTVLMRGGLYILLNGKNCIKNAGLCY